MRFGGEGESIYGSGGSLSTANPWRKILVLVAGPLMNLLLAAAIFGGLYAVQGVPTAFDGLRISHVHIDTPAERAGLKDGDLLLQVADTPVGTSNSGLSKLALAHAGVAIPVLIERNGQRMTVMVTPAPWVFEGQERPAGFGFSYGPNMRNVQVGLPQALVAGFFSTFEVLGAFLDGLRTLVLSLLGLTPPPPGGVTGVVGMARGTGEVIQNSGLVGFLRWTALISLNLFLINLLPIPALDGSHIVFSLIEIVRRGKKIPPEKEAMVHAFGFMLLMGLMVLVTISDVANWIRGAPVLGGG